MKFIVDAQLPKSLALFLREKEYDVIHTLDLPNKNNTTDKEISELSIKEKRIVISKDVDFYIRYFQKLEPYKLLYLTTGNISNQKLIQILDKNLEKILEAIELNFVVEIDQTSIIVIH